MNSLCNITDERECINIIFFYVLHAAIDMRKYFQFSSIFFEDAYQRYRHYRSSYGRFRARVEGKYSVAGCLKLPYFNIILT